jgi:hypothetical protein
VAGAQVGFEVVAEGAGPHVGHEAHVVDGDDAGETRQVEDDAPEQRHARAAHPATATGRRNRYAGVVAAVHHGGHLGRRRRAAHD